MASVIIALQALPIFIYMYFLSNLNDGKLTDLVSSVEKGSVYIINGLNSVALFFLNKFFIWLRSG